jgi:prepilin-type N-terminal cleavage/methylation domain-containing protein
MKGFTLIEILIVVAISAMLSAIAISYTGIARNTTALSVESYKVAGFIFQAKDLAVATYNAVPGICGYGVSFNDETALVASNTYSIFAFKPDYSKYPGLDPSRCPSAASTTAAGVSSLTEMVPYLQSSWNVRLANGVRMLSGDDNLRTVLFYPPNPRTLLSHDGSAFIKSTLRVYLATSGNNASTTVSVNGAGQVSF